MTDTDEELMMIIANSAQELIERGYTSVKVSQPMRRIPPVLGCPQDNRFLVECGKPSLTVKSIPKEAKND
jgi:hypothetical protein